MKKDMGIIIIAIALAVIAGLYFKSKEFKELTSKIESEEMSMEESQEYTMQTEEIEPQKNEVPNKEEYKAYFENAKFITVEKVERTITESLDGSSDTCYDTYFVSDVYMEKGTDFTEDYASAMIGNEFEEELVSRMEFEEAFGFSYAELDAWEIYEKLLSRNGIAAEIEDASFDEDTFRRTTQIIFVMHDRNADKIWNRFLQDESYDEIISKKVCYQVMTSDDGITYPDCFTAELKYRNGETLITKSIFLQVIVNR